jgi:hypothetical protein
MTELPTIIAERTVILVHPDGRREPGRVWIGLPEQLDAEVMALCPAGVDGLSDGQHPIAGTDTLQALLLATRLAATLLRDFQDRGGQVLHPEDDEPVDLDAYFGTVRW